MVLPQLIKEAIDDKLCIIQSIVKDEQMYVDSLIKPNKSHKYYLNLFKEKEQEIINFLKEVE